MLLVLLTTLLFLCYIPSACEFKPGYAFDFCEADHEVFPSSFLLDYDFSIYLTAQILNIYKAMSIFISKYMLNFNIIILSMTLISDTILSA